MSATQTAEAAGGTMKKLLDVVEKVGNKVPHPAIIFLVLMVVVVVLSHVLHLAGASVTQQVIDPLTDTTASPTPSKPAACSRRRVFASCTRRSSRTSWASPPWA